MQFDHFPAVIKEKLYVFTIHPLFQHHLTMYTFKRIFLTNSHNISKWHPGSKSGEGEGGYGVKKAKKTLKNSLSVYEKEDFRLFSKHQLYKCNYTERKL